VGELVEEVKSSGARICVITGGEPAVHDLHFLSGELHESGIQVHLETSGAFEIQGEFDWITVSPKKYRPPLEKVLWMADEIKIIVEEPDDIDLYIKMLLDAHLPYPFRFPIWLHPEWGHRDDPKILKAINDYVMGEPGEIRAGYQIHKLYHIDPEVRGKVPLGGDPSRGF